MPSPPDNKIVYRFSDFTLANFRRIISKALDYGFSFVSVDEDFSAFNKCLIWRHDVEFSPEIALKMAKIEADENVRSNYFFQLHSEYYNVLEKRNSEIVKEIRNCGHFIGLHFDTHYFNINSEDEIEKFLRIDKEYFESLFGIKIKAFSFHNTDKFVLSCKMDSYAGILNVYSEYFKKEFNYCADSTGFWRYELLEDVLKNPALKRLQVLTHDAMWQDEVMSPRQRIHQTIDKRAKYLKDFYDATLKKYGAKNVDWNAVF